ncbi:MAG: hypothetical protein QOI86_4995, partial [Actinomycetota bacterium]|nr:hypothetical protein [Actinomycetota bacterium]
MVASGDPPVGRPEVDVEIVGLTGLQGFGVFVG